MERPEQFTSKDDKRIRMLVKKYGTSCWKKIAEKMDNRFSIPRLQFRYYNLIRTKATNKEPWYEEDYDELARLVKIYGTKWTYLAQTYYPNRVPYFLKNRYKTYTRRKEIEAQEKAHEERVNRMIEEYQLNEMAKIFPDSLVQEYYDIYGI